MDSSEAATTSTFELVVPSEEESLQPLDIAANANETNDENDRPLLLVIVTDYNMQ